MKKTSIIISVFILGLALVVGVVGITAAWFGDTNSVSQTIVVSSAQPAGSATIVFDTAGSGQFPQDQRLRPAVLRAGIANEDRDGSDGYDIIPVPYVWTEEENGNTITHTENEGNLSFFDEAATTVSTSFKVKFAGSGTAKTLRVEITSATLVNPREQTAGESTESTADDTYVVHKNLPDYKTEFASILSVTPSENDTPEAIIIDGTTAHALEFTVTPRYEYTITAMIYFKYADEFTSVDLINTQVFFNFELYTL